MVEKAASGAIDLIGDVYDAALHPDRWNSTLEQLSGSFDSEKAILLVHDARKYGILFSVHYNLDPHSLNVWSQYVDTDPFSTVCIKMRGQALSCRRQLKEEKIKESAIYQNLMIKDNIEYRMGGVVQVDENLVFSIMFFRSPMQNPFTKAECERLSTYYPHLRRAIEILRRLEKAEMTGAAIREILNTMPIALAVVDSDARIRFANDAVRNLAENERGISINHGLLLADSSAESRRLRVAVNTSINSMQRGSGADRHGLNLERMAGRPLGVLIAPIGGSLQEMDVNNRLAIVYIEDPDVVRKSPRDVLMRLYDLTQAESEILVGLVNGLSVADVAEMRGVTTGTTREQLKSIFRKTNCERQSELVILISQHPVWRAALPPAP